MHKNKDILRPVQIDSFLIVKVRGVTDIVLMNIRCDLRSRSE